ncbi:MAG: hypothetical protein Q9195_000909 [Heterodermia aff. obscurata]
MHSRSETNSFDSNIGIVCSNLPLLGPVINAIFPPSLRSSISKSWSGFGFSSRRNRAESYRLSDEENKFASIGSGGSAGKQTARARIEPVAPKQSRSNWFSRTESFDEGEEMVNVGNKKQ